MNFNLEKIKILGEHGKFSWEEAFEDKNGKTSVTSLAGAYITFIGGLIFAVSSIAGLFAVVHALDIVMQSVIVLGIGGGLLGVNKVVAGKTVTEDTSSTNEEENVKP